MKKCPWKPNNNNSNNDNSSNDNNDNNNNNDNNVSKHVSMGNIFTVCIRWLLGAHDVD